MSTMILISFSLIDLVLPDLRLDWLQGLVPTLQIVSDDGEYQGPTPVLCPHATQFFVHRANFERFAESDAVRLQAVVPRAAGDERRAPPEAARLLIRLFNERGASSV